MFDCFPLNLIISLDDILCITISKVPATRYSRVKTEDETKTKFQFKRKRKQIDPEIFRRKLALLKVFTAFFENGSTKQRKNIYHPYFTIVLSKFKKEMKLSYLYMIRCTFKIKQNNVIKDNSPQGLSGSSVN